MPNVEGQVSQSVGVPVMPSVNLMPPEIAEAARFRRFQLAMGGAVVAAIAVVGLLYSQAHSGVGSAQSQLDQARAQHTTLQSKVNSLQSVQDVYTQVASHEAMLSQAMGGEIRWSRYLNDLSLRMPDHVWLTSVSATEVGGAGSVAAAPTTGSVLTTACQVGSLTLNGVAFAHDDVATWLDTLGKERGFVSPYFTNSTETPIGPKTFVNFSSSVNLNNKAESGRYSKPAGC